MLHKNGLQVLVHCEVRIRSGLKGVRLRNAQTLEVTLELLSAGSVGISARRPSVLG